jgi:hypothetical protein
VKPVPPVDDPRTVARAIVRLAEAPERERPMGAIGTGLEVLHALAPALCERVVARRVEDGQFLDVPSPRTPGNLFQPMDTWTEESGGWRAPAPWRPLARVAAAAVAGVVPLLAWRLIRTR